MVQVVGIRFKKAGKVYYFDPNGHELRSGDHVIVETTRGTEYGVVTAGPKEVPETEIVQPLKKIIRKATRQDEQRLRDKEEREQHAFTVAQQKADARGLPMKIVGVEYAFDGSKLTFFFTAEGRIDFRELVRDLAATFRTRIEMRQIGVRDEAKILGGMGCCGRELCCYAFLGEFAPVSIRMAKDQQLSLNPGKISGLCGRLMCCLKYENDFYECCRSSFPPQGKVVMTPQGRGKVVNYNVIKNTVTVELDEPRAAFEFPLADVHRI